MLEGITRRTLARLTVLLAATGSIVIGWLSDGFDVEIKSEPTNGGAKEPDKVEGSLPRPGSVTGKKRVSTAIADRRSRREYDDDPLTRAELGQLLWAAQGTTERRIGRIDFRAAPSAGATYPIELYIVIGDSGVRGLEAGIYHYEHDGHTLDLVTAGDVQPDLRRIALDQAWVGGAAADIIITAIDERTTKRYGPRGRRRYVPMEAGHVGENIYLQTESLGLATVAVGAFRDSELLTLLGLDDSYRALTIYPVGRRG